MKINYKQSEPFGCGLYSVANVFGFDDSFVTPERIELSKQGNSLSQLNRWLIESGHKFSIEPWYYNHEKAPLPESFFDYRPMEENVYVPVMFDVQTSEFSKRMHFVSGLIDSKCRLYLFDSYKDDVVETSVKDLNKYYFNVFGFYHYLRNDGEYMCLLK